MIKQFQIVLAGCLMVLCLGTGCKRSVVAGRTPSSGYFQTDFQEESQFIVETIATDLAEQVYYAKFHHTPAAASFQVTATEAAVSSFSKPVYDVEADLDGKLHGLKVKVDVDGPIWAPEVYDGLVKTLATAVGLDASVADGADNGALLARLTDGTALTIEKENKRLSSDLEDDFGNPALHEQAAVLLGAFTLREHSGDFYEIRSPLCRITAHLAMARYLRGGDVSATTGRMATAMLLTLMNNQAAALDELSDIKTNNADLVSWVRALQARNSRDYRPLDKLDGLSGAECSAWFYALDRSANTDLAWGKLSDVQKKNVDFVRIANEGHYSVGTGHELLALALPLEFSEIASVYDLSKGGKLKKDELVPALNQMPDRCFSDGTDNQPAVHVIGWGLWAGFLQRQLCHAVQEDFDFLQRKWGVPDDAKKFSDQCDQSLADLRLYPFVRRFNCTDVADYHRSVDDGFKVTVATPQLVPAECWNYLCYEFSAKEYYAPNPNPHVNEWHKHNPPPGTAYNPMPRLDHPSLTGRPDSVALLDQLHELAPYDRDIADFVWKTKYKSQPTYAEASALFQPVVDYDSYAMAQVADTLKDQPAAYELMLSRAVELDPTRYFNLANYCINQHEDDKAAADIEKGNQLDPDSVTASYYASWLIKYYLKKGRVEAARKEADFAGEVYSDVGLQAKAEFLEATGDYSGAFEWFGNIEDRYDDPQPLIAFCLRYKAKTGDSRYDVEIQHRLGKIFPKGIEKVSLRDFQAAPVDGTLINGENDLITSAGLHEGDVIVAIDGIRVHNFNQYNYGRDRSSDPELDLIVWQGQGYHEIKTSPPNHRFGVDFGDYVPK